MRNLLAEDGNHTRDLHRLHLETAISIGLDVSTSPEATESLSWLKNNALLGYTYIDKGNLPRIVGPSVAGPEGITIVIIDDYSEIVRMQPMMRDFPMYHDRSDFISMPIESFSWTGMLSILLAHEGIHAKDFRETEAEQKATLMFEGVEVDDPLAKASEIKAFQAESQMIQDMFGEKFGAWFTKRIGDCVVKLMSDVDDDDPDSEVAVGICTVDEVIELMNEQIHFFNPSEHEFYASLLTECIPTCASLEMCTLMYGQKGMPHPTLLRMQLNSLGEVYH